MEALSDAPPRSLATHAVGDIEGTLQVAREAAGVPSSLKLLKLLWARGVQTYEVAADGATEPRGPLADLYEAQQLASGAVELGSAKIGAHYQHLEKPAWEFAVEGQVVAKKAATITGASEADVPWLVVELQPNTLYSHVLRLETRGGLPLPQPGRPVGWRHGSSYETLYAFLGAG